LQIYGELLRFDNPLKRVVRKEADAHARLPTINRRMRSMFGTRLEDKLHHWRNPFKSAATTASEEAYVDTALLAVSKQIGKEAGDVFYETNTFILNLTGICSIRIPNPQKCLFCEQSYTVVNIICDNTKDVYVLSHFRFGTMFERLAQHPHVKLKIVTLSFIVADGLAPPDALTAVLPLSMHRKILATSVGRFEVSLQPTNKIMLVFEYPHIIET